VEPFAIASLWSVWALSTASTAARKSGRVSSAIFRNSSWDNNCSVKSKRSGHVELLNRSAVVKQRTQLNLRGAQVDESGLQVGLILHALQFQPVEIDLCNVAGAETISTDLQDFVVVGQVIIGQLDHGFGLQRRHKCAAQVEKQRSFRIRVRRDGDSRRLFRALQPQFPLVIPLVQVIDCR
jgi:hypothetical protein